MQHRFWIGLLVALLPLTGGTANGADYTSVVGTPNCYLKADAGITLTNGRVSTWADQSGSSNNATSGNSTNGTTSSVYVGCQCGSGVSARNRGRKYRAGPYNAGTT